MKAEHGNGEIDLLREVPEAMKPRRIEIATGSGASKVIENTAAASGDGRVEQLKRA